MARSSCSALVFSRNAFAAKTKSLNVDLMAEHPYTELLFMGLATLSCVASPVWLLYIAGTCASVKCIKRTKQSRRIWLCILSGVPSPNLHCGSLEHVYKILQECTPTTLFLFCAEVSKESKVLS
jgi:hypothetical protein